MSFCTKHAQTSARILQQNLTLYANFAQNTHKHVHTYYYRTHAQILFPPNGFCGTVTVTATATSVPAVEQNSVREKQQQVLRSQLQDYLSLNKLHYCFYYPGIQSLGKKHFAEPLFTQHPCAPHSVFLDCRARKG